MAYFSSLFLFSLFLRQYSACGYFAADVLIPNQLPNRRLDPPEMNTSQLLLVSSLGLGVNLFGMFAMGGHHHHVCELPVPIPVSLTVSKGWAFPHARTFS